MRLQSLVPLVCLCTMFPRMIGESAIKISYQKWDDKEESKCECGVFRTVELTEDSEPFLEQTAIIIITVICDEAVNETCHERCNSLGNSSEEEGPFFLCATVRHGNDVTPSVFTRICNFGQWYFTGLTAKENMCCHNKRRDFMQAHNRIF